MENWQVAILTLVALVAGLSIPVLLQLWSAVREMQRQVRDGSARLAAVLDDVGVTAARARRVSDGIDGHEQHVGELLRAAGDLAQTLDKLRSTAHVASAAAAAVIAGFRAFRDAQTGADDRPDDRPETAPAAESPGPQSSDGQLEIRPARQASAPPGEGELQAQISTN